MSQFDDVTDRDRLTLRAPTRPITGTLRAPGSKSLTNRALLLATLADGTSMLRGALDAEDTRLMVAALRRCGVHIETDDDATTLQVVGVGGPLRELDAPATPIEVGTAGTVARFLGAVLAASPVVAELDGSERMRERPMGELLTALVAQGATVEEHAEPGHLPLRVSGVTLSGGEVVLRRPASSQIVSALVLAAVLAQQPTRIVLTAGTPARPYVDMTLATVAAFGGDAAWIEPAGGASGEELLVRPSRLRASEYAIEPDASAATYLWGLAALHGGAVSVPGLGPGSLQGDVRFLDVLEQMGATVEHTADGARVTGTGRLSGVDVDLTDLPDPGLTLAALALRAEGPTRIRGVAVHRHHETDRIAAAATELRRLGAEVVEHEDGLDIDPPAAATPDVLVRTYRDHRMAMAFAILGDVVIEDPGCVAKTWPAFFGVLDRFGMVVG